MTSKLIVGWLEHKEARLYWLDGKQVTTREHILSEAGSKREENPREAEDLADKKRARALSHFYDEIIRTLNKGEKPIYLLGHKQALREFQNHCERKAKHLVTRLSVTPADRMTEPQILAYGREQMK